MKTLTTKLIIASFAFLSFFATSQIWAEGQVMQAGPLHGMTVDQLKQSTPSGNGGDLTGAGNGQAKITNGVSSSGGKEPPMNPKAGDILEDDKGNRYVVDTDNSLKTLPKEISGSQAALDFAQNCTYDMTAPTQGIYESFKNALGIGSKGDEAYRRIRDAARHNGEAMPTP